MFATASAQSEIIELFNIKSIIVSHHATLATLDKLSVDHDDPVKRWQNVLTRNLNSNVRD